MTSLHFRKSSIAIFLFLSLVPLTFAETVPVSVSSPKPAELGEALRFSGSVVALRDANVSVRVDGLVEEIIVDAGVRVKKGQPLLRQDEELAALQYKQALAMQEQAEATKTESARLLSESQRLQKSNHVSQNEVSTRQANFALADAALKSARANAELAAATLKRHTLLSPFDGVVNQRLTDNGEWLSRGDPAFAIVSPEEVVVDVNVPQERYADILSDTSVRLCPDTRPGYCVDASVAAIIPVGNATARAFRVRLQADGPVDGLLPGTSAVAEFSISAANGKPRLLISRDALLRHPDGDYSVFVTAQDKASRRKITVGREFSGQIEVVEGLQRDDKVVIRGNELLSDGQDIRIVPLTGAEEK